MENALLDLAGSPAAGPLDRTLLKAWTMGKSKLNSGEVSKEPLSAADALAEADKAPPMSVFTLRVKPDRRRVQLPITASRDRRHPR